MSFLYLRGLCPKTPQIPTRTQPSPSGFGYFPSSPSGQKSLGTPSVSECLRLFPKTVCISSRSGRDLAPAGPEFIQLLLDAVGCQGNALHLGSFSALSFLWYSHHAASCSLSSGPHHPPSGAVHSTISRSWWSVSGAEFLGPHLGPSKPGSFQKLRGLWVQPLFRQSWARLAISGTAQASLNSAEPCRAQPLGHSSDPIALGYFRNRSGVPTQPSRGHCRDPSSDPIEFGYFRK